MPAAVAEQSASGFTWAIEDVDTGAKPAIALSNDGAPYVAFMLEAMPGFVKVANKSGAGWDIDTLAEGYFYGPLDIGVGPDGTPHVAYHDHQGNQFDANKGDTVYAAKRNGEWELEEVFDPGHDGWDTRIFVDSSGNAHISAIDPKEFNGSGLEYYSRAADGSWTVERIGTGDLTYKYATSVAVDPQGTPHISYFDQKNRSLALATRGEDGWSISTVDGGNDTGLFSELYIDGDGRFHISYFARESSSAGKVMYATRASGDVAWETRVVDSLDALSFGFIGARNITSIALDSSGTPFIAYTDEKVVKLAVWDGSTWQVSAVFDAGQGELGQIVALALDDQDRPHLTYFEVTNSRPLDGMVKYAVGTSG